jgi:NAD(P)-dependent dehydrogenase (short-subunit alcohol dehydrogenase family)
MTMEPALVTGGSRGLGRALCRQLAAGGSPVAFTYTRDEPGAAETLQIVQSVGAEGRAFKVSVLDTAATAAMVSDLEAAWGRYRRPREQRKRQPESSAGLDGEEDWDRVVDINLKGTFVTSKAVLRGMIRRRGGVILNIGSLVSLISAAGAVEAIAAIVCRKTCSGSSPSRRSATSWSPGSPGLAPSESVRAGELAVDFLPEPVRDPTTGEVVRGQLHRDRVAGQDPDAVHSHLARHVGQDLVAIVHHHPEHRVGQRLDHLALHLDCIFLAHGSSSSPFICVLDGRHMWIRAEMQKALRPRWLSRPGLGVTDRKEPTPESVSRIRRLPQDVGHCLASQLTRDR